MKDSRKKPLKFKTIGWLKLKADKRVQDHYRKIKTKCELCGAPYQVIHHFIPKSQSNYLRYDEKNYIFVCHKCHSKFHAFPDPLLNILVARIRGEEWVEYIKGHCHLKKRDNRKELEEI